MDVCSSGLKTVARVLLYTALVVAQSTHTPIRSDSVDVDHLTVSLCECYSS